MVSRSGFLKYRRNKYREQPSDGVAPVSARAVLGVGQSCGRPQAGRQMLCMGALEDELKSYELRKGTVHFPLTKPVPVTLISRIAKLRAAGIADTAKKPLGREKERRKPAP